MDQTGASALKRIEELLDAGSFVEIGAYISSRNTDFNLSNSDTPKDGVFTGYGTINDSLVYVYSQDSTVLGGSIGEMHAKKIMALYDMATKMGAPIIGLIDCAGLRLQESFDALDAFGKIYLSQSRAKGVIPQIQAVFGLSGGGMAVSNGLSDFVFMEENKGRIFVNSPNAIENNSQDKNDYSTAKFQSEETLLVDFVGNEGEIISGIRELISLLPANNEDNMSYIECNDDLNRVTPDINAKDPVQALRVISDNGYVLEVKKNFAKEMVTAFIRLNGNSVGVVANRGILYNDRGEIEKEFENVLSHQGSDKAVEFVGFCDAFNIPVLTLVDVKGFRTTKCSEKRMPRAAARLVNAYANATVPKVSLIVGDAVGSAALSMNSKSIGADIVFAWESAKMGMMDAKEAVKIIYSNEISSNDDAVAVINEKTKEYNDLQNSIVYAAKRGFVDDIITVSDTRKRLIAAFEMLFTKRPDRYLYKKNGTV